MGIKGLNQFLRDTCPGIFEEINIEQYAFKKVAVDISLYMCKYKAISGDRWLTSILNLVTCFRRRNVHCIFIYDGASPPEKMAEQAERREARGKIWESIDVLESAMTEYHETGKILPVLVEFYDAYMAKTGNARAPRLRKSHNSVAAPEIDIPTVRVLIDKKRQQLFRISPADFELTRALFTVLKIPFYIAPMEAETMCADLCKRGLVDCVLTEDTDVLAYGASIFLSKLDLCTGKCRRVIHIDLLTTLELTADEFLDFCIMCGTDYNKNIPKIGPAKSFALIEKHRNVETIAVNTDFDISILNHNRTRELFTSYEQKEIKVLFCGKPVMREVEEFLLVNNIRIGLEAIKKAFVDDVIVFA